MFPVSILISFGSSNGFFTIKHQGIRRIIERRPPRVTP